MCNKCNSKDNLKHLYQGKELTSLCLNCREHKISLNPFYDKDMIDYHPLAQIFKEE